MGNCHPEKTNVDRAEAEVDIGFRGLTISPVPSRAVNNHYIILNVSVIKYVHHLHNVWLQNNQGQVNICVCVLVRRIFKRSYDASQNLW